MFKYNCNIPYLLWSDRANYLQNILHQILISKLEGKIKWENLGYWWKDICRLLFGGRVRID